MSWVSIILLAHAALLLHTHQLDRLIQQLGSDRFSEREAATRALDQLGMVAVERLRDASSTAEGSALSEGAARDADDKQALR
jgi:hypothetical protein